MSAARRVFSVALLTCSIIFLEKARADDFVCDSGGDCVAPAFVDGNFIVTNGSFALVSGSVIRGNVEVEDGGSVLVSGSLIDGNIEAEAAADVVVQGSEVDGNIEIKESVGVFIVIQFSDIFGNVEIEENDVAAILVGVEGSAAGNLIYGNLEVFNNSASGFFSFFIELAENTILGNLECGGNNPDPVGIGSNAVAGNVECDN